jgi:hypothetical protein
MRMVMRMPDEDIICITKPGAKRAWLCYTNKDKIDTILRRPLPAVLAL